MDSVSFTPPARRSMSDDELANLISQHHSDEASVLKAMQLLEAETDLRADDDALIAAWCDQMRSINSWESINALNIYLGLPGALPPVSSESQTQPKSLFEELAAAASIAGPIEVPEEPVRPANVEPAFVEPAYVEPVFVEPAFAEPAPSVFQTVDPASELEQPHHGEYSPNLPFVDFSPAVEELTISQDAFVEAEAVQPPAAQTIFPLIPVSQKEAPHTLNATVPETSAIDLPDIPEQATEASHAEVGSTDHDFVADASDFDSLIGIAPQASAAFLDDAKTTVSTAHGLSSNQNVSSLFFNWLPIMGSVAPVIVAVYLNSLGLSLSEGLLVLSLAIFGSFVTSTTGAIAGRRSGLQTFIVSRATFGVYGARVPAAVTAVIKLATASVLLLLIVIASNNAVAGWSFEAAGANSLQLGPVSLESWQILICLVALVVSAISFVKLRFSKFLNLFVGLAGLTFVSAALTLDLISSDVNYEFYYIESWQMTLGASAVAFVAFGVVWSSSGADFAFGLHKTIRGSKIVGWSFLSLVVVPLGLGAATLFALQDGQISSGLLGFASILPDSLLPYGFSVLCSVLLLLAAIELRSTRLALKAVHGWFSSIFARVVLTIVFIACGYFGWQTYGSQGIFFNLRDYSLMLSVPIVAWLGIFTADTIVRRIAFHEVSLTRNYGFYGNFNLTNFSGWLIASAAGFGLLSSTLQEFAWSGFLSTSLHSPFLTDSNLGLLAAFTVGALFSLAFGIPRIRRQEAEVLAIESRRHELRDVLVVTSASADSESNQDD